MTALDWSRFCDDAVASGEWAPLALLALGLAAAIYWLALLLEDFPWRSD